MDQLPGTIKHLARILCNSILSTGEKHTKRNMHFKNAKPSLHQHSEFEAKAKPNTIKRGNARY